MLPFDEASVRLASLEGKIDVNVVPPIRFKRNTHDDRQAVRPAILKLWDYGSLLVVHPTRALLSMIIQGLY